MPLPQSDYWEPLEYVEMVVCPICGAGDGEICEWRYYGGYPGPHNERVRLTMEALEAGRIEIQKHGAT